MELPSQLFLLVLLFGLFLIYSFVQEKRIIGKNVGESVGAAAALTIVSWLLPSTEPIIPLKLLTRLLLHFASFTLGFRLILKSDWRNSIGIGVLSVACFMLLEIFG